MNAFLRLTHRHVAIAATLFFIFAATNAPARTSEPPQRVQVTWAPNDQLSEIKDNPSWRGWLKPADWQKSLSDHLRRRADRFLPAGQTLQVTIQNIKLAGDYEPWRGVQLQDVRFMTDLYPPRIDLHYKLLAADGATIREGDAQLRDMNYLYDLAVPTDTDALRYDKALLDRWVNKEFRNEHS